MHSEPTGLSSLWPKRWPGGRISAIISPPKRARPTLTAKNTVCLYGGAIQAGGRGEGQGRATQGHLDSHGAREPRRHLDHLRPVLQFDYAGSNDQTCSTRRRHQDFFRDTYRAPWPPPEYAMNRSEDDPLKGLGAPQTELFEVSGWHGASPIFHFITNGPAGRAAAGADRA